MEQFGKFCDHINPDSIIFRGSQVPDTFGFFSMLQIVDRHRYIALDPGVKVQYHFFRLKNRSGHKLIKVNIVNFLWLEKILKLNQIEPHKNRS